MSFAIRRIWGVLPVVFGVLLLTFLLVHLVPGDPVEVMLGDSATSGDRAQLRAELGLDQSLPLQFGNYLKHVVHGDFGRSIHQHTAISTLIAERVPATFKLALLALVIALSIGLPLGIAAALHHLHWPDRLATLSALTLSAMPHFWLGPLLMLVFSLWLGWLPISGMESGTSIVLPALTLACGLAAILTRMTRASLLETLNEDFVRTARAKGLPERLVILRHALKHGAVAGSDGGGLATGFAAGRCGDHRDRIRLGGSRALIGGIHRKTRLSGDASLCAGDLTELCSY